MYTSLLFRVTDLTFDLKEVTLEDQYSIYLLYIFLHPLPGNIHTTAQHRKGFFINFYFSL